MCVSLLLCYLSVDSIVAHLCHSADATADADADAALFVGLDKEKWLDLGAQHDDVVLAS